jgi:hypothetical protein
VPALKVIKPLRSRGWRVQVLHPLGQELKKERRHDHLPYSAAKTGEMRRCAREEITSAYEQ